MTFSPVRRAPSVKASWTSPRPNRLVTTEPRSITPRSARLIARVSEGYDVGMPLRANAA